MKPTHCVARTADDENCYCLRAASRSEATEIVTTCLADLDGPDAWAATPAAPNFDVKSGTVYDSRGAEVRPQIA